MNEDDVVLGLVGATVQHIYMDADRLKFSTDRGDYCFVVYGECCSTSYFYDFLGVKKLLENGPILQAYAKDDLATPPPEDDEEDEFTQAYGFAFVTEDPHFGEVTSVLSFRNDSNGYYGGEMEAVDSLPSNPPELFTDCLSTLDNEQVFDD